MQGLNPVCALMSEIISVWYKIALQHVICSISDMPDKIYQNL